LYRYKQVAAFHVDGDGEGEEAVGGEQTARAPPLRRRGTRGETQV